LQHAHQLIQANALFSKNEEVEDIPTSHLKYLQTDYYLAELYTKVVDKNRFNNLVTAKAFFLVFLQNCETIGILKKNLLVTLKRESPPSPKTKRQEKNRSI